MEPSFFGMLPIELVTAVVVLATNEEPSLLHPPPLIQTPLLSRSHIRTTAPPARVNVRMRALVQAIQALIYIDHNPESLLYANLCIERSKSSSIDLSLVIPVDAIAPAQISQITKTLCKASDRIKHFKVFCCHINFLEELDKQLRCLHMPMMTGMDLQCPIGPALATIQGPSAPRLEAISLTGLTLDRNLSRIIGLEAQLWGFIGLREISSWMNQMESLEDLRLDGVFSFGRPSLTHRIRIKFPRLTSLCLLNGDITFAVDLLRHLDAPRLQTVSLTDPWAGLRTRAFYWNSFPKEISFPMVQKLTIYPVEHYEHHIHDADPPEDFYTSHRNFLIDRFPGVTQLEIFLEGTGLLAPKAQLWHSLTKLRIHRRPGPWEGVNKRQKALQDVKEFVKGCGGGVDLAVEWVGQPNFEAIVEDLAALARPQSIA